MKEIEDEAMKEERENERARRLLSPLKAPDSIETRLLEENSKMMERSEGRNEWRRE